MIPYTNYFTVSKADKVQYVINKDQIKKEEMFDGFYGICTDLEASPL